MAARAGAVIADAEFVQFHPTAIDLGLDPTPLATEALRGEGARLVNAHGARFMAALHPDAAQTLVDLGPHLFAIQRRGNGQTLLALHNVTDRPVKIAAHVLPEARVPRNVVASTEISGSSRSITLAPYEVAWISD